MKKNNNGFTLVELIVVLVILAVLAAILVPALLGWIDKSKESKYLLEARNVVQATQVLATEEYASGIFIGDGPKFIYNHASEILNIADASGEISKIEFPTKGDGTNSAILQSLTYITKDGILILYTKDGNPVYKIGEKGSNSHEPGAPTYAASWPEIIKKAIADGTIPKHQINSTTMQNVLRASNNGKLPSLTEKEKNILNTSIAGLTGIKDTDNLVWTVREVTSANNIPETQHGYIMTVCKDDGTQNTNTSMIYYDNAYYVCVENHPNQGTKIITPSVTKNFDVSTLTNAPFLDSYDLSELEKSQIIWLKCTP